MELEEICYYQFFGVKAPKNNGNCEVCITDEYNKNCINYFPMNVLFEEVEGKIKE